MTQFFEVLKSALAAAKEAKCTRFPGGNGYKEGYSAFEFVNKAFEDANLKDPSGKLLKFNKSEFNKIINSVELKQAGLTRFDGENGLRVQKADVLSLFGLTAAPKSKRNRSIATDTTNQTDAVGPGPEPISTQVQDAPSTSNTKEDDFGDFD